jgi:putative membrane protein
MFLSVKSGFQLGAALTAALLFQCGGESNRAPAEAPMPPAEEPAPSAANNEMKPPEATPSTDAANTTKADAAAAAAATPAPAESTTLSDGQIAAITQGANSGEVEEAKLARAKSKNPRVLQFANMMIAHHGDALKKQEKLKITPVESPASADLTAQVNKTIESLKQKNGAEFDQAYMQSQVDGHKEVLDTINAKLLPNVKSPELKAYLEEIKPKVEQHLALAQTTHDGLASQHPAANPASNSGKTASATQK